MTRFILFLILFCTNLLSENFIISYRGVYADQMVYNESFMISKAMIPSQKQRLVATFDIPIPETNSTKSLIALIRANQDLVIEELFKQGVLLTDNQKTIQNTSSNKLVITLPAQQILATINGRLVRIAVLEK